MLPDLARSLTQYGHAHTTCDSRRAEDRHEWPRGRLPVGVGGHREARGGIPRLTIACLEPEAEREALRNVSHEDPRRPAVALPKRVGVIDVGEDANARDREGVRINGGPLRLSMRRWA